MELSEIDIQKLRDIPIISFFKKSVRTRVQHVCCPFHNEKSPSLAIYPDNSYHCFGCGAHGKGAIDFTMKLGNVGFKEACASLGGL